MNNKKIFFNVLSIALATSVGFAHAQTKTTNAKTPAQPVVAPKPIADEAILFKIQDISPVTNADGVVTSCDFSTVFFNRSNSNITGAVVDFEWKDASMAEIAKSQTAATNARNNNNEQVSITVDLPEISSLKQATVRSRLQSDRCFILLEEMNIKSRSCQMQAVSASGGRTTKPCGKMFRYVAPTNPDYYKEFKVTSTEDEKKEVISKKEKIKQEVNSEYNLTIQELNKASQEISTIK